MGTTTVSGVLESMEPWLAEPDGLTVDGLTVSGGEPLEQPEALAALLRGWREQSQASVLLFSGYEFDRCQAWLTQHPGLVDALVAGPYRAECGQTLALRGSDNQSLHILSARGEEFAPYQRRVTADDLRLDVSFDVRGDAWFAGIPAPQMLPQLRRLLGECGHAAQTSDLVETSPAC